MDTSQEFGRTVRTGEDGQLIEGETMLGLVRYRVVQRHADGENPASVEGDVTVLPGPANNVDLAALAARRADLVLCFSGWAWECALGSASGHLVNRGRLYFLDEPEPVT